jgi:hypothetical protein
MDAVWSACWNALCAGSSALFSTFVMWLLAICITICPRWATPIFEAGLLLRRAHLLSAEHKAFVQQSPNGRLIALRARGFLRHANAQGCDRRCQPNSAAGLPPAARAHLRRRQSAEATVNTFPRSSYDLSEPADAAGHGQASGR